MSELKGREDVVDFAKSNFKSNMQLTNNNIDNLRHQIPDSDYSTLLNIKNDVISGDSNLFRDYAINH